MSVKKSLRPILLLGALAVVIAGNIYLFSTKQVKDTVRAEDSGGRSEESSALATTPASTDNEEEEAAPEPAPTAKPKVREQPDFDHYFKRVASRGRLIVPETSFDAFKGSAVGDHLTIDLDAVQFSGKVVGVREGPNASKYALNLDEGHGRIVYSVDGNGVKAAQIAFNQDSRAFWVSEYEELQSERGLLVEPVQVSDLYCAPPGVVYPLSSPANADKFAHLGASSPNSKVLSPLSGVAAPPKLDSIPGAEYVLYCDFDGELVEDFDIFFDGIDVITVDAPAHPKANIVSWVTAVWQRVAEDFAPFDITVTTDRDVYDAADEDKRLHVVITPDDSAAPGAGGVAADIGYFRTNSPVCWVFNLDEHGCASTISHEAGHVFGLSHDGRDGGDEYYGGHNTGYTPGWAPIMGAPWSDEDTGYFIEEVDQWSRGEYLEANNQEDDLSIIGSIANGFGFKEDDFADTYNSASLPVGAVTNLANNGITGTGLISETDDVDVFSFVTASGEIDITVSPLDVDSQEGESDSDKQGANLAVNIRLLDENGNQQAIGTNAGPVQLASNIKTSVSYGKYYIEIDGGGRGAGPTVGFSDYGSLGQYTISGTIATPPLAVAGGNKVLQPVLEGATEIEAANGTDFGFSQPNASPVSHTFHLSNTSNFAISNLSMSLLDGSVFTITSVVPNAIPVGASVPVTIAYDPDSNGLDFDTVSITYDGEQLETFNFTIGGTCSPTANEDNYENGMRWEDAENLTSLEDTLLSQYQGLGWMSDAQDMYKFTVDPGDQLITVETFHDPALGAIQFELYRYPNVLVATMSGDAGAETLQYLIPDNSPSRKYYILVKPVDGTSLQNTYDLRWNARVLGTGDGDLYEDNDTAGDAFNLTNAQSFRLSEILGTATQTDEDWYRLDVARDPFARFIYVSAEFVQSEGDINIQLYDANLNQLSASVVRDSREFISYFEIMQVSEVADTWTPTGNTAIQGVPEGTYYVRVSGDNAGNEYDLFFGILEDDTYETVSVEAEGEVIENDTFGQPFDLGDAIIGTSLSNINGYGMTADYADIATAESFINYNDADFYKFTINQSNVTQVQVEFTGLGVSSDYLEYRIQKLDGTFVDFFTTNSDNPATETYTLTINNPDDSEYLIYVAAATDIGFLTAYDFTVNLVTGQTILPGAVEDNYEENDRFDERFDISGNEGSWLTSIDGYGALFDADWYKINVPEGATQLEVIARSDSSLGNIDLYVTTDQGLVRQESLEGGDTETIIWEDPDSGPLSIVVVGDRNGNRYNLFWDVTLPEDNYEENDTRLTSFDLSGHERRLLRKLDGFGIQNDEDWYQIEVDAITAELRVIANFTHAEGDIDVELYNDAGYIISRATSSTDDETLIYANPPIGNYYVRVYYENAGNEYDLTWAALTSDEVNRINTEEDAYEENDSLEQAYELTEDTSRLSNHLGLGIQVDDDWYAITVGDDNFGFYVECLFDDTEGDLDFEIYDDFGTPIVRRDSDTDNEILDLQTTIPGGVYYIRVYGPNLGTPYDLYFLARTEDVYEENDTRAEAYDITSLDSPLSELEPATQSDADWYVIDVPGDYPFLEVTLDYIEANGSIDFSLIDANGDEIITANSTADSETVFVPVEPGLNYIYVFGSNAFNTYDLTWTVYQDDQYEENDISDDAADITATPLISAVQFDEDWYRFEVTDANSFLSVIATFTHDEGNIDLALYSSTDLGTPIITSASSSNSESVQVGGGVGTYYVQVTGDNTNPAYQLLWTVAPDDQYEQNDEIGEATDLTGDEGVVIDAIQYDEDWYEIVVQPGNVNLTVELLYLQSNGNINLTLYDASGVELEVVDTPVDNEELSYGVNPFEPGPVTYYIKISGINVGTEYSLSWVTSIEDGFEGGSGNNTFEDASDVLLGTEGQPISGTIGYGGALNDDWYLVQINPGDSGLLIEALFEHSDTTNIDLELFDANKLFIRRSIGESDVERIQYNGPAGTYYLRVFGSNGNNPYDLVWNSYNEDNLEKHAELDFEVKNDTPDNDAPDTPRGLQFTDYNKNFYPGKGGGVPDLEYFLLENLTQLDEDWYAVEVFPGEDRFIVEVQFEHIYGDIDIAVYDRATETLLDQSETLDDGERIEIPNLPPGQYLICVYGYGINNPKTDPDSVWVPGSFDPYTQDLQDWVGYDSIEENADPGPYFYELDDANARGLGNTYSLQWVSSSEDQYDEEDPDLGVNDTQDKSATPELRDQRNILDAAVADPAPPRSYTTTNDDGQTVQVTYRPVYEFSNLAQFDEDWFEIPVDTGGSHQFFATIYFNSLHGNLDLYLYAENGTLIDSSISETGFAESVEASGTGPTNYYLQVVGNNLGVPYDLEVRGFFDDVYEENETLEDAYLNADISSLNGVPLEGLVSRDIDLYRIYVPENQVYLYFGVSNPGIAFETTVLDSEGNELPGGFEDSGRSQAANDNVSAGVIAPEAGEYYLRVAATSGLSYGLYWYYNNIDQYEAGGPFWSTLSNNDTSDVATELTRFRLEPTYDPDSTYLNPIKEFAFDYGLLGNLMLGDPAIDPFGHAIQEADDWYAIQIPSWFLTNAKKGDDNVQVIKRLYYARLFAEIEFVDEEGDINLEIYDETDLVTPLARSASTNDIESLFARIDPLDEARYYYIRVYGDNAANDYTLKWDVTIEDAYEELEDNYEDEEGVEFNTENDTNNFIDIAYDLTNVDGVSTEGTELHLLEYLQDVNGDGVIDASDDGFTSARGYGIQRTDDWYAVVVSEGSDQIMVDCRFYSDNDTNYDYKPDDLDIDFEVYFLAGNDGDPGTSDLRKPVLIGRSTEVTDDTLFVGTGEESKQLSADITTPILETATFDVDEPGIYFIRIYYDNRSHPYTFMWDDLGAGEDSSGDAAIIDDYFNGDWSFALPEELPAALLAAPNANNDGDQFPNWAEYALALNAEVPDYAIVGQSIAEIDGKNYFQYEYLRSKEAVARGFEFIVQETDTMVFGDDQAVFVRTEDVNADVERVIYRCSKSLDQQAQCFFRLVVNEPVEK